MSAKDFILNAPTLLRTLDPNQRPLWGSMTPQHMIEHLVGSWRISNGRAKVKAILEGEALKEKRDFLFSDQQYEHNIFNPIFKDGLPPLRKASLEAAIDQLEDEMQAFFQHFDENKDAIEVHTIYGELNYDGWLTFQYKHMLHHLKQFGLA